MDGKRASDLLLRTPPKREWVVHKFPIKNGSVIRAAMQLDLYDKQVPWSAVEGVVKS